VGSYTLVFSPDSTKIVYVAQAENKQIAVVNGKAGEKEVNKYNSIVALGKKGFAFETSDRFRFLAVKEKSVYSIEVKIN
jgi:hypothetical protein